MSKRCYDDNDEAIMQPPKKYAKLTGVKDSWLGFVKAVGTVRFQARELEKVHPAKQRIKVWTEARKIKGGKMDDDVKRIVKEGESIVEALTSEELLNHGPDDVLAKVMKNEYHGRVLTSGHGVTKKDYFRKRIDPSRDSEIYRLTQMMLDMQHKLERMGEKLEVVSQVQGLDKDLRETPPSVDVPVDVPPTGKSEEASCPTFLPDFIPQGESFCDMYVISPTFVKVGSGLVFRVEGQKLHTRPLGADQMRVCLKEIVPGHEDTPLPCREVEGEFTTVRHALNTFVAWPINLVSLQKKVSKLNNGKKGKSVSQSKSAVSKSEVSKRKVAYPREGDVDDVIGFHVCKTHAKISRSSVSFDVEMPETHWGSRFADHLSLENMREIITHDWLGASTICFYIRYLCDVYLINEDEQQSNTNVAGNMFVLSLHM